MSTSPINNLSSYVESTLSKALQSAGVTANNNSSLNSVASSSTPQADNGQLSPLAQMLSTLQQLQESDPTKYAQVTGQIATNLQKAAQTATADGNTTAANQLNQLAADFTNASNSGQLPNIQDLAKAIGGGHHHHHHHSYSGSADSEASSTTSDSSTTTSSSGSSAQTLFPPLQSNGSQSDALNPTSIILNTLSNAGV